MKKRIRFCVSGKSQRALSMVTCAMLWCMAWPVLAAAEKPNIDPQADEMLKRTSG